MKTVLKSSIAITAICMFIFSCSTEEKIQPSNGVSLNEKYLEFEDMAKFQQKVKELHGKSRVELDAWDKQMNFSSLRSIYENIIDEENVTFEKEEALIERNQTLKNTMKHQESSLIAPMKEHLSYTSEGLDYKLFDPSFATLLNKDGVVQYVRQV